MTNEQIIKAIQDLPTYDYRQAVKDDIRQYIDEHSDELQELIDDAKGGYTEKLAEKLQDDCFISDSVTGNASGSYFCNSWKAQAAIMGNWDLIQEAQEEFGLLQFSNGPECIDCSIRCFLVGQMVEEAIDEYLDTIEE